MVDKIYIALTRNARRSCCARAKPAKYPPRHVLASKPECPTVNRKQQHGAPDQKRQRTRSPEACTNDTSNAKTSPKHKSQKLAHFFAKRLRLLQARLKRFHNQHDNNSSATPYRLGDKDILHRWRRFIFEGKAKQSCVASGAK